MASIENKKETRGEWTRPLDFFFSCLGYAVGLGNVWRFPFLCYKHGGGSFLIPYFIVLFLAGLPVFFLEIAIGQYAGVGPIQVFGRLAPILKGLGFAVVSVGMLLAFFYIVVVAWSIWYLFASFTLYDLPWATCNHTYNSLNCFELSSNNSTGENLTSSVQEYWDAYVLGNASFYDWNNFGTPNWQSAVCLLAAWFVVTICLINGVKSSGYIVYITTIFPYVVLISLAVRGGTLPGAYEGIMFYITPKWNKLLSIDVWVDASTQVIFSLGPACGCVITLASYNDFKRNCHLDSIIVAFSNCCTSIFSGFVVFSILGYLSYASSIPIENVINGGPGLAFIVYPTVVISMPGSQVWAVLFFLMLINLALGSIFGAFETVITSITDQWPQLRSRKPLVVIVSSSCMFLLGISFTTGGGIHMFNLFNSSAPSWNLLLFALMEVVSVGWIYDADTLLSNLTNDMSMKIPYVMKLYWKFSWKFVTPVVLSCLLISAWMNFGNVSYENYTYPLSIQILGYLITTSTIIWIPVFVVFEVKDKIDDTNKLLRPTSQWGRPKQPNYGGC